jgi:formamidopyrimidine-DNA glycosylase
VPELPEVETIARKVRPILVGKRILSASLRWRRTLALPSPAAFEKRLVGQRVEAVSRRAKFLRLQLSRDTLLIHLRMSGDLTAIVGSYRPARHDRLILDLSGDTHLVFNDARKFGRVWLTEDPDAILAHLGPEPLADDFTPADLYARLHQRHRLLKPLLLDQTFLAGLGNIYTDEALHLARLHPLLRSDAVTSDQAARLWRAIREVLGEGIRRNGASIDWVYRGGDFQNHFRVYGRTGKPCPVCGTPIERMVVGQRGTHYCPKCQLPLPVDTL